jgi:hypothetical protein
MLSATCSFIAAGRTHPGDKLCIKARVRLPARI